MNINSSQIKQFPKMSLKIVTPDNVFLISKQQQDNSEKLELLVKNQTKNESFTISHQTPIKIGDSDEMLVDIEAIDRPLYNSLKEENIISNYGRWLQYKDKQYVLHRILI